METEFTLPEDERLLHSFSENSGAAFTYLYDRFRSPLFAKAFMMLGCEHSAKDCMQDVFVSIWIKKDALNIHKWENYLFQAVRFQALKVKRQRWRVTSGDNGVSNMTDHTDPSKIKEYKELKAFLETKVSELPPDIGQVFRMHRDGGLTYPKIAEELEISVKTVEKKISIALRLLRKQAARSGAWDRQ